MFLHTYSCSPQHGIILIIDYYYSAPQCRSVYGTAVHVQLYSCRNSYSVHCAVQL